MRNDIYFYVITKLSTCKIEANSNGIRIGDQSDTNAALSPNQRTRDESIIANLG